MPTPNRSSVLEIRFPPDDYLCTWHVPGLNGETVHLPGSVELRASRPPFGQVHGDLPLARVVTADQASWTLPQRHSHRVVRATLANGAQMLLLDAQLTWHSDGGYVHAAAAILRQPRNPLGWQFDPRPEADPDEQVNFNRLRIQVGALDAILGVTPIGSKTASLAAAEDGSFTWSATTNPSSHGTWDGASVRMSKTDGGPLTDSKEAYGDGGSNPDGIIDSTEADPSASISARNQTREVETGAATAAVSDPGAPEDHGTGHGDELRYGFDGKVNTADFYGFSVRFAPVLDVTAASSTLFDQVRRYVDPVRAIASIATGASQPITLVTVARTGDPTHQELPPRLPTSQSDASAVGRQDEPSPGPIEEPRLRRLKPAWQLYGTGLTQEPFESDVNTVNQHRSVLRCADDGIDLLSLVHAWQRLEADHHPLIETYASTLHVRDQHPRSRYLLLIQSLEGMHGHHVRAANEASKRVHRQRRTETLARVKELIDADDYRFLRDNTTRAPFRSLNTALTWSFDLPGLKTPVLDLLDQTRLIQQVRSEEDCTTLDALRLTRNGLAHGTRGLEGDDLDEVNEVLDQVVRAHALRLLGCGDHITARIFDL